MMHVEHLTKTFGAHTVVNDVSFVLEPNTSTALIGPNGAGKTTTLSMLTGLLAPTSGQVYMDGVNDLRSAIGFLPQYPQFFPWLTALEFTEMVAGLSGVSKRHAKKEAERVLQFVGLGEAMRKKTATFSGGMKQRLGIAQAIVHQPKLLLLDEPVSALDPVGRRDIMQLLKELQQQTAILYSTHILNDAEQMTDQVLFLKSGLLVERGSLQSIQQKYAEPRYRITFTQREQAEQFMKQSGLSAQLEGLHVLLPIADETLPMPKLLALLSSYTFDVQKVERETANLEEIFMKVVHT